jgi:hypothetical protein
MSKVSEVLVFSDVPQSSRRGGGGGGGRKSAMLDAIRAIPEATTENPCPTVAINYDATADGNDFDAWVKNTNSSLRRIGAIPFTFKTTTQRDENRILVTRLSGTSEQKALSRKARTRATHAARKAAKEAAQNPSA